MKFAIAIMAAGKGTRLKSKYPKVIHKIGGRPLLEHVIRAAAQVVPIADVYAIIGHEAEHVRETVKHTGANFVVQAEQRGTGHAIMCAREALAKYDNFLVLSGDVPLIRPETIERVRDFHTQHGAAMTILTAEPPDPFGYGRVIRKPGTDEVQAIVEQKSGTAEQLAVREINSGIYAFASKPLFARIDKLTTDNPHGEFYLTDMAAILRADGEKVLAVKTEASFDISGVNDRMGLAVVDHIVRMNKVRELMEAGVTIFYPESCVIDSDVTVAPDTVIEPFVQLLGKTAVGADCTIRSYTVIENCSIGDRVHIQNGCILRDSTIGVAAVLGPYSHVRPATEIAEGAHVGNFVELKKTKLGRGSKANHLSYLGDSVIGEGVNIGAGTITCNYDGKHKHVTTIGDGAFIGSDSTLVAPVTIGARSYVGAASCVTEDVPADSLALGRARQTVKEGWAKKKRDEGSR